MYCKSMKKKIKQCSVRCIKFGECNKELPFIAELNKEITDLVIENIERNDKQTTILFSSEFNEFVMSGAESNYIVNEGNIYAVSLYGVENFYILRLDGEDISTDDFNYTITQENVYPLLKLGTKEKVLLILEYYSFKVDYIFFGGKYWVIAKDSKNIQKFEIMIEDKRSRMFNDDKEEVEMERKKLINTEMSIKW